MHGKCDSKKMKNEEIEHISDVLKAIGHPTRFSIMQGLMNNECCVADIQQKLALPQSTISQHLNRLKASGIIKERKEGTRRCYRIIDKQAKKIMKTIDE